MVQSGRVRAEQQIHPILGDEPFRRLLRALDQAAVVVVDDVNLALPTVNCQPALRVDVLRPGGDAGQRLATLGGKLPGQRRGDAGFDQGIGGHPGINLMLARFRIGTGNRATTGQMRGRKMPKLLV